jgi:hypothetical protein
MMFILCHNYGGVTSEWVKVVSTTLVTFDGAEPSLEPGVPLLFSIP